MVSFRGSPFGRVKPRTITMLGNSAISRDIISMSASAPGVRRSRGDLMNSTIGVIAFIGKWRFIASYPLTLSTCCGTVLRSS
ncbi:Uncharacterised protein [Mycobacterium tuberculosis]|uniref:Uncharacterized protein n=1 Tax=Mycobacterium tuberculosis TaxID=1773 RepID=A0A655JEE4_MYCTX|nr:Uncharacterised protein [Mycobacterium tuberculosis]CFS31702.1 Uncharacterised protein [Mycobacterium tuberculosis]COW27429.1 Uncharacterised protein [Mycobacterium tuberculosis]COW41835.1 Uncharacterised protein [Mycobacterium tuberculosis]COW79687.1 Uncharacterised protein [Mycobacterium tuberculosis]